MLKSGKDLVDELIEGGVLEHAYDPVKAREYYLRTRKLKGRKKGADEEAKVIPLKSSNAAPRAGSAKGKNAAKQIPPHLQKRVNQLQSRLGKLKARLRELLKDAKAKPKDDGKKTASEKSEAARASQKYRDKHKTEIAQKRKREAAKETKPKTIGSMSETEVRAAIKKTRENLQAAVAQARAAAKN